jgi:feruloyl-CoA synthase
VINTQRMLTSASRPRRRPGRSSQNIGEAGDPRQLPWSHTFGANHDFNLVLRNGGTLIDGGKLAPGLLRPRFQFAVFDGLFRAARF